MTTTIFTDKSGDEYTIEIKPDADLGYATDCPELSVSLGWYVDKERAKIGSMLRLMRILNYEKKYDYE